MRKSIKINIIQMYQLIKYLPTLLFKRINSNKNQQIIKMSTSYRMSTQDIKQGLQNIKRAQLEVLRQLRGENNEKQIPLNILDINNNNQNDPIASNNIQVLRSNENQQHQYSRSLMKSSIETTSSTKAEIQIIKKQVRVEKQQLNTKMTAITNKLRELQHQNKALYSEKEQEKYQFKHLERQRLKLQQENIALQHKYLEVQQQSRKQKNQLERNRDQKAVINRQVDSLKSEMHKLSLENASLQRELSDERNKPIVTPTNGKADGQLSGHSFPVERIIFQVKRISTLHDSVYEKLKRSGKIQMQQLDAEQNIQISFNRLLSCLQGSSKADRNNKSLFQESNLFEGQQQESIIYNRKQSQPQKESLKQQIKRLQKQLLQLQFLQISNTKFKVQNESLKSQIKQWTQKCNTKQAQQTSQANLLITKQIQSMRQQMEKLRKYKVNMKQEQQELQQQTKRHRMKAKQLILKMQQLQNKLTELTTIKYSLQKQIQAQQIQISDLNAIIKKIQTKGQQQVQGQLNSANNLRQEFNKLLQNNGIVIRQKQSLKAMNDGLQVQIHNLKYEKQQFQQNNRQKHELIERQIKQRNHLLEQLEKKQGRYREQKLEVQQLKNKIQNLQESSQQQKLGWDTTFEQKNQEALHLRKQIQQLYQQSRQHHNLRFRNDKLQSEYKQLKRKSMQMTETLSHLWSIKQAEYQNVNHIVGLLKQPAVRHP